MKKVIFIDVDDTLLDSRQRFLEMYNTEFNENLNLEDLIVSHNYSITFPRWTADEIYKKFQEPYTYEKMYLVDFDLIPALRKLSKEFDLCIASVHNPQGIAAKSKRLQDLTISKFFSQEIYLSNDFGLKKVLNGYAIIDDRLDVLENSSCEIKILFDKYNIYNEIPKNILKARDWNEVYQYIIWGNLYVQN